VLLLTNFLTTILELDGSGCAFFFRRAGALPQIMTGKNLAHAAFFAWRLHWCGWARVCSIAALNPGDAGHGGGYFVCLAIDLAAEPVLIYSHQGGGGVFGRQRASLTTVLASFCVLGRCSVGVR